jgi:hypothetical protein
MKGVICLGIICAIYYAVWKYYPHHVETKHNVYMGIFVAVYVALYYLLTFESAFMYRVFQNIHASSQQPLYTQNSQGSNSELYQSQHPHAEIKGTLLMRQGTRCIRCQNYILGERDSNLTYITPLQNGGVHDLTNLGIQCGSCAMFS